jgi:hypothetical protein
MVQATRFDVLLTEVGPKKIPAIKVIRKHTKTSLGQAQAAVEDLGVVARNIDAASADALISDLAAIGVTATRVEAGTDRVVGVGVANATDPRVEDPRFHTLRGRVKNTVFATSVPTSQSRS